jgi:hypothetical protein
VADKPSEQAFFCCLSINWRATLEKNKRHAQDDFFCALRVAARTTSKGVPEGVCKDLISPFHAWTVLSSVIMHYWCLFISFLNMSFLNNFWTLQKVINPLLGLSMGLLKIALCSMLDF